MEIRNVSHCARCRDAECGAATVRCQPVFLAGYPSIFTRNKHAHFANIFAPANRKSSHSTSSRNDDDGQVDGIFLLRRTHPHTNTPPPHPSLDVRYFRRSSALILSPGRQAPQRQKCIHTLAKHVTCDNIGKPNK